MRSHFDSPELMNWSMMTWAPLAKSPNWASQITRQRGSARLRPYSNPSTPASDSGLSTISICAWPARTWLSGM